MNPFRSLGEYKRFIYTLQQRPPRIPSSTLVVARRGRRYAELTGELIFPDGHRLVIYERLFWDTGPLTVEGYSYEVWRGSEKLYWYDSQPHPHDLTLASTEPHHKHIPPNIKHHQVPAPGLGLAAPNLPLLIQEIEALLVSK